MIWNKPPAGARPNFAHRHAIGLAHAFLFNERSGTVVNDCVTGLRGFFRTGTPLWSNNGIFFNGASDIGNFDKPRYGSGSGNAPFSVVVGARLTGGSGFQNVWAAGSVGLYFLGQTQVQYYTGAASDTVTLLNIDSVVSFSSMNVTGVPYYMVNGVQRGISSYTGLNDDVLIGGHNSEFYNGYLSFIYVYKRYIAPAAMADIHANPLAMFQPAQRMVFAGSTAPTGSVRLVNSGIIKTRLVGGVLA